MSLVPEAEPLTLTVPCFVLTVEFDQDPTPAQRARVWQVAPTKGHKTDARFAYSPADPAAVTMLVGNAIWCYSLSILADVLAAEPGDWHGEGDARVKRVGVDVVVELHVGRQYGFVVMPGALGRLATFCANAAADQQPYDVDSWLCRMLEETP